ncbi:MAG: alpha/beta hydrolase [Treponema sp.]|uniref:alpha/beta hydrolase n=1 Tax=Treponema sp. TaxID=166 RepID=UPI002A90F8B3|nr:alpha/beta hydrolase [Treponema sp.]MDY6398876.1 alpha/beta hydrolase [Treponema sp.]
MNEEKKSLQETVSELRTKWAYYDKKRDEKLTVPENMANLYDISYGPHGESNLLDIYKTSDVNQAQATIVNIHGGAWVYGSKEVYKFYCMSLALRGFTVVNINYRLAPENLFPSALEDINSAITFIEKHAGEYCIDKEKLVLVGDSAGAQLASHYAAIFTNPDFAKLYGFTIPNVKIKAVGLNCGIYDPNTRLQNDLDDIFWAYIGQNTDIKSKDFQQKIDVLSNITPDFPPAFVMSSHRDFLLPQAQLMYDLLKSKGIEAVIKIYGAPNRRDIGHVFHVNMNLPEAKLCNDDECNFFRKFV